VATSGGLGRAGTALLVHAGSPISSPSRKRRTRSLPLTNGCSMPSLPLSRHTEPPDTREEKAPAARRIRGPRQEAACGSSHENLSRDHAQSRPLTPGTASCACHEGLTERPGKFPAEGLDFGVRQSSVRGHRGRLRLVIPGKGEWTSNMPLTAH
jgi:hypothetical protein